MKERTNFDLIIVGGGPTGISCAIEAAKKGLKYCILEKGYLVNSIYNFPTNMTFFSTSLKLEIADIPFISHNDKPTRLEALEYYRRLLQHYQLDIHYNQEVEKTSKSDDYFEVDCKSNIYYAKNVIVATGYYDIPRMLGVKGENLSKVKHYYDDWHPYIGKDIVVVGGANSACDVALETWSKGARVTMVVRNETLYENVKYWILPNVQNRIKEGAIQAHFSSEIIEIKEKEVTIQTPTGIINLPNDYVLAMTGYLPDYERLMSFGVTFHQDQHKTPIYNAATLETPIKGLYLAGVIIAGMATSKLFIENTRHHADMIIENIVNQPNKSNSKETAKIAPI